MNTEKAEKILAEEGWLFGPCQKADTSHHISLFLEGYYQAVYEIKKENEPRPGWRQDDGWGE
ncbi:MAG: hypothetical protein GXO75_08370 [Calditrichaeota bacterium]|nr:hypothetical protein [Calditrichota bacterium]